MKKNYIFVFMFLVACFLSISSSEAQDGFENYNEGSVPSYFSEIGISKTALIQVTTEDKWAGEKSLLLYKDAEAPLWEPYFKVKFTYTLSTNASLSFCAKIPSSEWLHFNIADSNGVEGPEFAFYGEWEVLAQHFHPGAVPASDGGNMTFPIDSWFRFDMTMKVGAAYDTTCNVKITELEGLKRTFTNTGFKFKGRPGAVKKFNGSLNKAIITIASDKNTPGTENGNVFIDDLLIPSNVPITSSALIGAQKLECNIYPNPSNGFIKVDSPAGIDVLQIFNMEGKIVFQKENISTNELIDISKLTKGIYAIQMVTGKNQVSLKLILDK